jgi:malate dehydrogenase (oxaloacetate-decarboxylating)(NADP+)
MLDVGTNNQALLDDPLYIGLRQRRVTGRQYDEFMDEFMDAVAARYGYNCLIQFEDFASHNAYRFLDKYRHKYCMFNDDIQGTAAVALAGVLTGLRATGTKLEDNRILFVGAGQAACGIADLVSLAISRNTNISFEEACDRVYMFDVDGLLVHGRPEGQLDGPKAKYAKKTGSFRATRDLAEAIEQVKPTVLIGATGVAGIFNTSVLKKMGELNERPLIFALSNPTSKAECTAEEAYTHTDGRCLFSSGSPFKPVEYKGKTLIPGQGNNSYIFPGVALATICCATRHIDEEVFLIAAEVIESFFAILQIFLLFRCMYSFFLKFFKSLSKQVNDADIEAGRLYPPMKHIRDVSIKIACEISEYLYRNGKATTYPVPRNLEEYIRKLTYDTSYTSYVPKTWKWPEEHTRPRSFDQVIYENK